MSAEHDRAETTTGVGDAQSTPSNSGLRRITTLDLLGADREIILEHEGSEYHLRITSNGRLILTK
jgi:hemin uptake protein HemP